MVRSKFKICSLEEKLGHWFESKFWSQSLKFVRCWQIPHWDTSLLMKSLLYVTFYFLEINVFLRFFRPWKAKTRNDYQPFSPQKVSCLTVQVPRTTRTIIRATTHTKCLAFLISTHLFHSWMKDELKKGKSAFLNEKSPLERKIIVNSGFVIPCNLR